MLMSQCIKLKAQSAPQTENLLCYHRGSGGGGGGGLGGGIKEGRVLLKGLEHKIDVSNNPVFHFLNVHWNWHKGHVI